MDQPICSEQPQNFQEAAGHFLAAQRQYLALAEENCPNLSESIVRITTRINIFLYQVGYDFTREVPAASIVRQLTKENTIDLREYGEALGNVVSMMITNSDAELINEFFLILAELLTTLKKANVMAV